jgi:hypothetical protein
VSRKLWALGVAVYAVVVAFYPFGFESAVLLPHWTRANARASNC